MRWAQRTGSYFYVIDAFIAGIIILGAMAVLFSQYTERPSLSTSFYTADDFFTYMEATQVRAVDNETMRIWLRDGTINTSTRSLLDQFGYFNATHHPTEARQLAAMVARGLPSNVGIDIRIDDQSFYSRSSIPAEEASVFFSSKRILIVREEPSDVFDPIVVEAQTWQ